MPELDRPAIIARVPKLIVRTPEPKVLNAPSVDFKAFLRAMPEAPALRVRRPRGLGRKRPFTAS